MRSQFIGIVLFTTVCCLSPFSGAAQEDLIYTAHFTKLLENIGLDYYEPVETWLHVVMPPEHSLMTYDLVLQNDYNDFEVRYRLDNNAANIPHHVELARLVATIATNDTTATIQMSLADEQFAKETYNAQAVAFARFTPKESFSEKPYGCLISLLGRRGNADVVLLYYDRDYDPVDAFRSLRFRDE